MVHIHVFFPPPPPPPHSPPPYLWPSLKRVEAISHQYVKVIRLAVFFLAPMWYHIHLFSFPPLLLPPPTPPLLWSSLKKDIKTNSTRSGHEYRRDVFLAPMGYTYMLMPACVSMSCTKSFDSVHKDSLWRGVCTFLWQWCFLNHSLCLCSAGTSVFLHHVMPRTKNALSTAWLCCLYSTVFCLEKAQSE